VSALAEHGRSTPGSRDPGPDPGPCPASCVRSRGTSTTPCAPNGSRAGSGRRPNARARGFALDATHRADPGVEHPATASPPASAVPTAPPAGTGARRGSICSSIVSRIRSLVAGPTVDAVPVSRNASRYSAVVQPWAASRWLPPTLLSHRPHRWHWTLSPSDRICPSGA
jgi:hypothetical protein